MTDATVSTNHPHRGSVQFIIPEPEQQSTQLDSSETNFTAPSAIDTATNGENSVRRRSVSITTKSSRSVSDDAADGDISEPDKEYQFGYCGLRPPFLQCMNNTVGAVVCICIANFLQGFANGVFGVMTSTLEKRFSFSSAASSLIASAYEVGPIPILIVFIIFGKRIHRPIAMSIGMIAVALGSVIFILPQFLAPAYQPGSSSYQPQTCDALTQCDAQNGTTTASSSESLSYFLPVFIVGRLLIGFGSTPILTFGINYIDDCSSKEKFAVYFGLYMAMNIMGPTIGALASSLLLNIFCNFYDVSAADLGLTPKDPRWIGAWWLPYAIVAVPSLLIALPLWGFPRDLPGASELRANKVNEVRKDKRRQSVFSMSYGNPSLGYMWHVFTVRFKSIVTNPMFWALTVYVTCDKIFLAINASFGAKYFSVAMPLSASASGLLFVCLLLPAGFFGTTSGGYLIRKLRLTCRQILVLLAIASCLTTAGLVTFYLPCPTISVAGITAPYNSSSSGDESINLYDSCNANCSCDDTLYQPVCGANSLQYFSPCFAGCQARNENSTSITNYYNCSCVDISSVKDGQPTAAASTGQCAGTICTAGAIFLAGFFITSFMLQITNVASVIATLRVVSQSETTVAVGMQVLISKVFGMIPAPILMGLGFDASCIWWMPVPCNPDGKGSCMLYDTRKVSNAFASLQVIAKGIGLVAMAFALRVYQQSSQEPHPKEDCSASVNDEDTDDVWKEPTGRKSSSANSIQRAVTIATTHGSVSEDASEKAGEMQTANGGKFQAESTQDVYKF